jgi:HD superfamily phosphodiesterase
LEEAGKLNPGPWTEHSKYAAKAARLIAEQCSHLDPDKAFVLRILHDIGRRYGKTNMRHSIDGYNFCKEQGYEFSKFTLEKWKATFELQRYFEERIGKSICDILPSVVENTFGF